MSDPFDDNGLMPLGVRDSSDNEMLSGPCLKREGKEGEIVIGWCSAPSTSDLDVTQSGSAVMNGLLFRIHFHKFLEL